MHQVTTKKNYSDADIVLSSDFVPPITIAPATITTDTKSNSSTSTDDNDSRKKTSSVSFSVEDSSEVVTEKSSGENKKSKVFLEISFRVLLKLTSCMPFFLFRC